MGLAYLAVAAVTVGYYWFSHGRPSRQYPSPVPAHDGNGGNDPGRPGAGNPAGPDRVTKPVVYPPGGKESTSRQVALSEGLTAHRPRQKNTAARPMEAHEASPPPARQAPRSFEPEPSVQEDPDTPAYSDAEPPQVTAIRFSPQAVRHGESVSVIVTVTDNLSGASAVSGIVRSPSGSAALPFRGETSSDDSPFVGTLTIPDRAELGRWAVSALNVSDKAHNRRTYPETSALLNGATFEVAGADEDSLPPEVSALYLDPAEAYDGDRVKITVMAQDDQSEIVMIYGVLVSPSKHAKLPFSCRKEGGGNAFSGYVTIPEDAESGQWQVDYLQVKDASQNTQAFFRANHPALFDTATLDVFASRSDAEPPTLDNLDLYPAAASYGETVDIVVYASDVVSGVSGISGRLQSPSRQAHLSFTCTYDPDTGTYKGEVSIPANAEVGPWHVDYILLTDKARNQKKYSQHADALLKETVVEVMGE